MAGKGFYVALSVCLVGAATAAWVSINKTLTSIDENNANIMKNNTATSSEVQNWGFPELEEAGKNKSGVSVSSSSPSSPPTSSSSSKASSKPAAPSKPSEKAQALNFILPVDNEIFAGFSKGELVKNATLNEWRTHNGIDIKADKNMAVQAVADGVVQEVYSDSLWGTVVEIKHANNLLSRYCGLSKDVSVKKGDKIKIKQTIGIVDNVPSEIVLPSHIHFEMEQAGVLVDPLEAMGKVK